MFWKFGYLSNKLFSLNRIICLKYIVHLKSKQVSSKIEFIQDENKIEFHSKEEGLFTQPSKFTLLLELSVPKELFSQPKDVYFYQFHNSLMRKSSQAEN